MIKMFSKRTKNQKGFTLVELIVVIAILGILAAVAVPRLSGFQESARIRADIASARTIVGSVSIAMSESDNPLPGLVAEDTTVTVNGEQKTMVPDYLNDWPTVQTSGGTGGFVVTITDGQISITANGKAIYPDSSAYGATTN